LELEISRDYYAELFDSVPVCFVMLTRTGIIREINRTGMRMLSPKPHPLIGLPFITFVAREDRKKFLTHLSQCRNNSNPTQALSVELKLANKPGEMPVFIELVSLQTNENNLKEPLIKSVFRDITKIKEMQETHRWLAAIVESCEDAIIGLDLGGKIISCNRGAERLFGYHCEELIGKPMTFLMPPDREAEEPRIFQGIKRGATLENYETVRRRKDGSLVAVSLTISPIRDVEGKILGISNITRDISERKEAERKVEESLERARAANRAKDDFLATLSHELRTPLNPVLLLASEGARNPEVPPQSRMDFDTIRKNVELEARLIDDMLDLTRITHGKLTLEKKQADVHSALQDAAGTVQADIKRKKIELVLSLKAGRAVVLGDAVRLRQIFWNLLKNAVKFTPEGGKILVETEALRADRMIARISDTGIGMTESEIGRVFGAFEQGTHPFGGLGLGLAISRALVELHDGCIRAESLGTGKGAMFLIELPLAKEMKKREASAMPADRPAGRISGKGIRILLVEDHAPTRESLAQLLARRNYQVVPAGSLAEARRLLETEKFNLLISDIGLPDGNGCDLMEEWHKRKHLKGIALTGYGMERDVLRSREAGFIAHLTKPVHIESLDNALKAAIKG
jgi:PAS domain S-box-containing protein